MKKLLQFILICAMLFTVNIAKAEECQDIGYVMEYATRCIDGYVWMMRVDRQEGCTIYLSPVSQMYEIVVRKGVATTRPIPCEGK